jgi:DNA (cytosine-5)-methyltransferase 1
MKYGSVCSGIEAATMAWEHMGWEAQWFSEIENFPSAVLAHHYPNVPNLGDMTKLNQNPIFNESTIDVLVGGTPCQSFSVAGLRKGLEDPRGNLALEFCRLAYLKKPKWIVWENVPGVLSSNGGKDFGSFLGALGELGYGFAYRVLDAQHFGVPQRRRRVFVVGHLGDWRPAAAVLFESESLCRNNTESGGKRKTTPSKTETSTSIYRKSSRAASKDGLDTWVEDEVANTLNCFDVGDIRSTMSVVEDKNTLCFKIRGGVERETGEQGGTPGKLAGKGYLGSEEKTFTIATSPDQWLFTNETMWSPPNESEQVGALLARDYKGFANQDIQDGRGLVVKSNISYGFEPGITMREGNSNRFNEELSPTLRANMGDNQISTVKINCVAVDTYNMSINEKTSQTLSSAASDINHTGGCIQNSVVRRLTPVECERLQGFPDNFTNIPYRNKPESPDGPRYKALGNSMAVPVMRWIGERINDVNNILNETR